MAEKSGKEPLELRGIGISSGVGYGQARVMAAAPLQLPQFKLKVSEVEKEITRLSKAVKSVDAEICQMMQRTPKQAPKEINSFLDVFKLLVNDPMMFDEVTRIIKEKQINAEWALAIHLEETKKLFENVSNEYLMERGDDVEQVVNRLQEELIGGRRQIQIQVRSAQEEVILVTNDLSLADVIWLTEYEELDLVGIITEKGGPNSHTAILSQTLFIPAVVGVTDARKLIHNGDRVFVDSNSGRILCNPQGEDVKEIEQKVQAQEKLYSEQYRARKRVAETKDRFKVRLLANVAMATGFDDILHLGAQGVGLYRSEYLFMGRRELPDEKEQEENYREIIEEMEGRPVTIRTLDVGGDKLLTPEVMKKGVFRVSAEEENPALGLRAIRFALANPSILLTQVRAILKAAYGKDVRILLPLISSVGEIKEAKKYIELAKQQLTEEKALFNERTPIGIMIELPAVAICPHKFLKEVDFASIGTNDLIQYTLGVDRGNAMVAPLFDELHPSVLKLLSSSAKAARQLSKPISVCGEMSGKPEYAPIFVGMGIEELSMSALQIPLVKQEIRELYKEQCSRLVGRMLRAEDSGEVRNILNRFRNKSLPHRGR